MEIEKIKEALGQDENLRKEILTSIQQTDEGKQLLDNYAKNYFDSKIGEKTSEILNQVDSAYSEILGEHKPANVKTSEYIRELATELKELRSKKGHTSREKELLEQLEKLKNDGSHNNHWKKTFEEASKEWQTKEQTLSSELEKMQHQYTSKLIDVDLSNGLNALDFNPVIPKEAITAMIQTVKNELIQNAKLVDGKPVYYKNDGTPFVDSLHGSANASQILKEKLSSVLLQSTPGGGAKTQEEVILNGDNADIVLDATKFNSRVAFQDYFSKIMASKGILRSNQNFQKLYSQAYKKYNVASLPEM